MSADEAIARGRAALENGRWQDARTAFEEGLRQAGAANALAGLGDALFFLGEIRESVRYRERAFATARRSGSTFDAVDSATWLCLVYAMALGNAAVAQGWLARAESLLADSGDDLPRAWVDYCKAVLDTDPQRSRVLAEEALASARRLADTDLEVCALGELGVVLVKLGDTLAGLRCVDEAMAGALGDDRRLSFTVVMTSCSMLTVCDLIGDLGRATQWSRAADEYVRRYGCPYLYAECRTIYGRILMLTGHWVDAETELATAAQRTKGIFPGMHNRAIASLAQLRLRQGRLTESEALIERIDAPVETSLVAAEVALRRGQPVVAAALVNRWLRAEPDPVAPPIHAGGRGLSFEMPRALCLLVEAQIAAEDLEGAIEATERLGNLASESSSSFAAAQAAVARGHVGAAQGRPDVALRCFEAALERFLGLELPLEAARARLGLARTLAKDQPALAAAEARKALSNLDRLGASADADVAAALLRSWGVAGRAVPREAGPLTRREREVLALLPFGLSNQEIAGQLHISPRTAAHHVSNLLSKLGLRNRAEAATYAVRTTGGENGEPST